MISAALFRGVMSCGQCEVLAEIKLEKEKPAWSFRRGTWTDYQGFNNKQFEVGHVESFVTGYLILAKDKKTNNYDLFSV